MIEGHLVVLLAIAAWWDWRFRRVPNFLVAVLGLSGLLFRCLSGSGWVACEGAALAFALTIVPVLLKRMGMGDQKLLMAVGTWIGGHYVYVLFLLSLLVSLTPLLIFPNRWNVLYQNMYSLAVGWVGHRRVWLPTVKQSACSLPFAISIGFSYCLLLMGERYL
ncbi:prepilin peptidase [Brevibacillus ginsengisoli]|uniref:prepilin peptidase n=1 Tax=Brevibacillus ginsengisoli TaxID=363854 RepID=UPI003CECAA3A